MKVIKQLKQETAQDKIRKFFKEVPVVTKAILIIYSFIAITLLIAPSISQYSFWTFFAMRFGELVLFNLLGLSDLKRQQGKGSFYIIISLLTKNLLLLSILFVLNYLVQAWPKFSIFVNTSIVIQYLFLITIEDALKNPIGIKYLFIEPFQVKSKFYPFFIFILLTIGGIRVDLFIPIVLGVIFYFINCNSLITSLSTYLDGKFYNEKLQNLGFLKTGSEHRVIKTMDQLATNDSVVVQ